MPDKVTVTVQGVDVNIEDNAAETSFPTDRSTWPANAHAPTVLGFKLGAKSFKKMSDGERRIKFAAMAQALTGLGRGARAGDPAALVADGTGRPVRSIAYGDSLAMGERAKWRARMLKNDVGASSCGMFSRGLLKMIGAPTASFKAEYVDASVFSELSTTAGMGPSSGPRKVQVLPGQMEPWLKSDGTAYTDSKGKPILRFRTPNIGDIVVIADKNNQNGHTFVIVDDTGDPDEMNSAVVRTDRDGVTRAFIKRWYVVAQGGQQLELPKYPDDGSCMGANQRSHPLDPPNWHWDDMDGGRNIMYWIDIANLGELCDDQAIVEPDRKMTW